MTTGDFPQGILILYNESLPHLDDNPEEVIAEQGGVTCAHAIAQALESDYPVVKIPVHDDGELRLASYPCDRWLVFNLTEDPERRLFEHIRIPFALEAMGYCFTGNRPEALAYTTNKWLAKRRLLRAGIPTPPGWLLRHAGEVGEDYPFPLIVKPAAKDASLGIEESAVVADSAALRQQVEAVTRLTHSAALAEQYIAGREISADLWGDPPEMLPLSEITFPGFPSERAQILTFDSKWVERSFDFQHTQAVCPAKVGGELRQRISETALQVWESFDCCGYAGLDFRLDDEGIPWVIDINCNPDLSPDAGFYRAARAAGYDYKQMALHIVELARCKRPAGSF